jgi:penicillin-binding protein 1A
MAVTKTKTKAKARKPKKGTGKSTLAKKIIVGMWSGFAALLLGLVFYLYSVSINLFSLYGGMPGLDMLENAENALSTAVYAADGKLLGTYYRQNRVNASYDELSPNLVNSLIAVEDARFQEHSGLDGIGFFRVAVKTVLLGQNTGGGSTLSQQTAKVLFNLRTDEQYEGHLSGLSNGLDILFQKTKEWILAVRLEKTFTKNELLALYLNTVEYGGNAFGILIASKTFFNKLPIDLDVHEAAMLAGIVQNPTRLNPVRNPEAATTRRNVVLNQMAKYGYLTEAEAESYKAKPLSLKYKVANHNEGLAPYFRTVMREYLSKWAKERRYDIYKDGLKVYTTIDTRMQRHAEAAVQAHMAKLQAQFEQEWKGRNPWRDENHQEVKGFVEREARKTEHYRKLVKKWGKDSDSVWIVLKTKRPMRVFSYKGEKEVKMSPLDSIAYYMRFLHTGMMAMDPYTGAVKAWVGGIDHKHFKFDHVKQGKRQPGSTFKPFVYATAIENGYSPCYQIEDIPRSYDTGSGTPWSPNNSDGTFTHQPMTLREALARSMNTVTAELMHRMKPENVVSLARRIGIESELEPTLALALGTSDVSVFEMVSAYSSFVNKGIYTEPNFIVRITDKNDNVLWEPKPKTVEALNEETAYLMLHMLTGGTEMGVGSSSHLSPALLSKMEVGGKTGTTQNASDGWFMGITPELVAGVWVGGDNRNIRFPSWVSGQGGRTAMPIWDGFMMRVMKDKELGFRKTKFTAPENPLSIEVDCEAYNQARPSADPVLPDAF